MIGRTHEGKTHLSDALIREMFARSGPVIVASPGGFLMYPDKIVPGYVVKDDDDGEV
jgi:hypothetical protein